MKMPLCYCVFGFLVLLVMLLHNCLLVNIEECAHMCTVYVSSKLNVEAL